MEISADEWYDIQNQVYVIYFTEPSLIIKQMHLTTEVPSAATRNRPTPYAGTA